MLLASKVGPARVQTGLGQHVCTPGSPVARTLGSLFLCKSDSPTCARALGFSVSVFLHWLTDWQSMRDRQSCRETERERKKETKKSKTAPGLLGGVQQKTVQLFELADFISTWGHKCFRDGDGATTALQHSVRARRADRRHHIRHDGARVPL